MYMNKELMIISCFCFLKQHIKLDILDTSVVIYLYLKLTFRILQDSLDSNLMIKKLFSKSVLKRRTKRNNDKLYRADVFAYNL